MNVKTASVLGLGVAVIALGGMALWLTIVDAPPASAQQVVESACSQMEGVDNYDISGTITGVKEGVPWEEAITIEASLSGDDYHVLYTARSDGATMEYIRVGGVGYVRESLSGNVWEMADRPLQDLDVYISVLGDSPVCPSTLEGITKSVGDLMSDDGISNTGEDTTQYTSGEGPEDLLSIDADFRGVAGVSGHVYLVDGAGLLVQHRHDLHQIHVTDDSRVTGTTVTTKTFSGVGEANTITVPEIP